MIAFATGYFQQRMWNLPVSGLLLSIAVLAGVLHAGLGSSIGISFCVDFLLATCLVWQFRVWDDLVDREHDCRAHPERVTCRPDSMRQGMRLLVLLAVGNLVAIAVARSAYSVLILGVLNASIASWYAFPWRLQSAIVNYHVVLLKYPAMLAIVAITTPATCSLMLAPVLLALYLTVCVYEAWHDSRLRGNRTVRWLAWSETAALSLSALVALAMTFTLPAMISGD